jgi:hypothetical protein
VPLFSPRILIELCARSRLYQCMANLSKILLNGLLVLAALSVALLRSTRGKYWGPEGPVGGWLLCVPPVVLFAIVLAIMIGIGRFDWIAGGRPVAAVLLIGFLIAAAVALGYAMDKPDAWWQGLVGVTPWIMLAGCFLALNPGSAPGALPKILMAATLGTTAVAGWVLTAAGAVHYVKQQDVIEQSKVENASRYEQEHADEFRALGTDAPLWNYFGYMYLSDEALRRQCRDIIAHRPDLNARLIEYLGSDMLSEPAASYIGAIAENPSAELGPAFARYMQTKLEGYREVLRNEKEFSDRGEQVVTPMFAAAARLQKAGADLKPQITAWRDYLHTFKNAAALEHAANELLK